MTQHYQSPQAFKMALEQRLRNEALRSGQNMERLRQLLVFDRFLARIFSCFAESVVLKGGLVLELRLERARTTKDIDLRMMDHPDDILQRLQTAGRLELGEHLRFEVRPDHEHLVIEAEGLHYEGRRFRAEARLAAPSLPTVWQGLKDSHTRIPPGCRESREEGPVFLAWVGNSGSTRLPAAGQRMRP